MTDKEGKGLDFEGVPEGGEHRFVRFGRAFHLDIADASDLALAVRLDEALWVANSAPLATLQADEELLRALDDGDGRLRVRELKERMIWTLRHLKDYSGISTRAEVLRLDVLRAEAPDGAMLERTARKVLERLNAASSREVTLAQVREVKAKEAAGEVIEAGKLVVEAVGDEALRGLLEAVVEAQGAVEHRAGKPAVDLERVATFFDQASAFIAWLDRGAPGGPAADEVLPLGEGTAAVWALVQELSAPLAQFFRLAQAVTISPEVAGWVWSPDAANRAPQVQDAEALSAYLERSPIARPTAEGALDLGGTLNPHYEARLRQLREAALAPLLGAELTHLDAAGWATVQRRLQAYGEWLAARPDAPVTKLDEARLRGWLAAREGLEATLKTALDAVGEASIVQDALGMLERLILYQAWMLRLASSFVSFPDLYSQERRALFEMGTLIMDGRRFAFAVRVLDRARHAAMSNASNMFVLYVEVSEDDKKPLYEVAVPVTSGGRGNLQVGKRGVFHDVLGRELHAKVVQIVDNPISLWEACLQPFIRMGQAITSVIEKTKDKEIGALETAATAKATSAAEAAQKAPGGVVAAAQAPPPAAPAPAAPSAAPAGGAGGLLAGGGIALAALGSSLAFITRTLEEIGWVSLILGVLLALAAVLVPVTVVAWLKLRRRDLSAILEGSDWGINARMRLTRAQARTFTRTPSRPPGSRLIGASSWAWLWILLVLAVLAVVFHFRETWLPWITPAPVEAPATPGSTPAPPGSAPAAPGSAAAPPASAPAP